jgi:hypothetical protein
MPLDTASPRRACDAPAADQLVAAVAPRPLHDRRRQLRRAARRLERVEVLADDLERQVLIALQRERDADPLEVGGGELAVPGCGAHRVDDPLLLEEAELEARTSGNSGVRRASTWPMLSSPVGAGARRPTPPSGVRLREIHGRGEEVQPELADAHLVAVVERAAVDALAVDVGAVQRALIDDLERRAGADDLGVPTGDGDVVEEDVRLGVPADRGDRRVEQVAGARERAGADQQQRGTRRERGDRRQLDLGQLGAERDERQVGVVAERLRGVVRGSPPRRTAPSGTSFSVTVLPSSGVPAYRKPAAPGSRIRAATCPSPSRER